MGSATLVKSQLEDFHFSSGNEEDDEKNILLHMLQLVGITEVAGIYVADRSTRRYRSSDWNRRDHNIEAWFADLERLVRRAICRYEEQPYIQIDFIIQWCTQNADPLDDKFHCFFSHFFTTLDKEGAPGVENWTRKKGINTFEKKFVFFPIHQGWDWSLCVVVNPGFVKSEGEDDPMACLLFFDPMRNHETTKSQQQFKGGSIQNGRESVAALDAMVVFDAFFYSSGAIDTYEDAQYEELLRITLPRVNVIEIEIAALQDSTG